MKKRILALMLAAGLLLSATACGEAASSSTSSAASGTDSSSEGESSDGESSESGAAALDTSEEVELVLYVVSDEPAGQDTITDNFNTIAKEKLNATLKINYIGWAEYANKYPLLFSSGEEFDLAYSATWLNFSSLAQRGAFMNLDELWPTYAPNNFAQQSETALQQATVNGSYYAIPTLLPTYSAYGPIYRTDVLEGTDWDGQMETFEDYEEYMDIIKETTDMEPIAIYQSGSEIDSVYMKNQSQVGLINDIFYFDPSEENPQIYTMYEYEGTPDFLEMVNRWNEKGFFGKSALSDTDSTKFDTGIAASFLHNIDAFEGRAIDYPDYQVQYANFATDVSNLPFTQDACVVPTSSKNPERALALYDLITSDEEAFMAFFYGIEGTTYELDDNDQITIIDPTNMPPSAMWASRVPEFVKDRVGSPESVSEFKAGFDEYIQDGVGSQKYASFVLDTTPFETELAACQAVHQQYWWPLELGYTDQVTGLQEYQEKMEAAGVDTVIAEIQTQLDAYIASLA